MKLWSLSTKISAALLALLIASLILTGLDWHAHWIHEWMPNFIAEWSGLLLAVAIVDRLLARDEQERATKRRAPLRKHAGIALSRALIGFVNATLAGYVADTGHDMPYEPVAEFIPRWVESVRTSLEPIDAWITDVGDTMVEATMGLRNARRDFEIAFDEAELAVMRELEMRLDQATVIVRAVATFPEPQRSTSETRTVLADALQGVADSIAPVMDLRTALQGDVMVAGLAQHLVQRMKAVMGTNGDKQGIE